MFLLFLKIFLNLLFSYINIFFLFNINRKLSKIWKTLKNVGIQVCFMDMKLEENTSD